MSDMNYIGAIVKLLETPKQKFLNSNTLVIKFRAQIPQVRKSRIVKVVIWGKLALAVLDYYKINDYLLIEGYASLRDNNSSNGNKKSLKNVTISVLKVYPLRLNYNRFINKLS